MMFHKYFTEAENVSLNESLIKALAQEARMTVRFTKKPSRKRSTEGAWRGE